MSASAIGNLQGQRIAGRYELLSLLGRGKFGEVWKVFDHHRHQVSALKLMMGTLPARAWDEATLLTHLRSPHILEIRNADLSIDVPYIETALATAGTLEDTIGPLGIEAGRAISLTRNVLQGLELCHQMGILHRDIKPSNVFLTHHGDAQLGDFGVAGLMDPHGHAPGHGDPDVRPPEVLDGGKASVASDVYSSGITLWAMLAGHLPFDFWSDKDFSRHAADVAKGPAPIRDVAPHVGRTLGSVIRTATQPDPNQRYASAAEFDRALSALPATAATFQPIDPHADHEACWEVKRLRDGQAITVCHARLGDHIIDVRRVPTSTRLRELCAVEKTPAGVRRSLRAVFDGLR